MKSIRLDPKSLKFVTIDQDPLDVLQEELEILVAVDKAAKRTTPQKPAGEHMSLKALAVYSGLSERTLRTRIASPVDPLPHQRVGRRLFIKRVDFDVWIAQRRKVGSDVEERIAELREREKKTRRRKAAPA